MTHDFKTILTRRSAVTESNNSSATHINHYYAYKPDQILHTSFQICCPFRPQTAAVLESFSKNLPNSERSNIL